MNSCVFLFFFFSSDSGPGLEEKPEQGGAERSQT